MKSHHFVHCLFLLIVKVIRYMLYRQKNKSYKKKEPPQNGSSLFQI